MAVSAIVEVIAAIAQVGLACAAGAGVYVAYVQLHAWRNEHLSKRRSEIAENVFSAAMEVDSSLRYIRSPWGRGPGPEDDPQSFHWRERMERIDERKPDFERLRSLQALAKAYFSNQVLDEAIAELFRVRQEVWAALATLHTKDEDDDGRDSELRKFYHGLQWKAYGTFSERDELGARQEAAIKRIESIVIPIIAFRS